MPIRHPFASAQYSSRAFSADIVHLTAPERLLTPPPQLPPLRVFTPLPSHPHPHPHPPLSIPSADFLLPPPVPPKDSVTAVAPTHYVKHSSKVTLLLSGQPDGLAMPIYSNGDTLDGVLALPKSSGLLSLNVKVRC